MYRKIPASELGDGPSSGRSIEVYVEGEIREWAGNEDVNGMENSLRSAERLDYFDTVRLFDETYGGREHCRPNRCRCPLSSKACHRQLHLDERLIGCGSDKTGS